jgi:hypothetical protein
MSCSLELLGLLEEHENSTQRQTRVTARQKWHAGTGGTNCGLKNYQWSLDKKCAPIEVESEKRMKQLRDLISSNNISPVSLYLHNTQGGRGTQRAVTHYGELTGRVFKNHPLKPDEDPSIFFHDQNLAPTGWEEKHGRSYCINRAIYAVEVREWIKLDSPCPGAGSQATFYTNEKTQNYPTY